MPFIEVENGRLFYKTSGKGRPLVLIHGAWATHEWWQWQVPDLSHDFQVITLDIRGHGKSTPLTKAYSIEGFTRDLEFFLQKIGIEEAVLIGWSMGGMISMQYCLSHPENVNALILVATRGHRHPQFKRQMLLMYVQSRLSLLMDFSEPRKYDRMTKSFPGQKKDWLEREIKHKFSPAAPKEVLDWVTEDIRNNPRENFFPVIKSAWNWAAGDKLKQIHVPTLIMVGENDTMAPPRFSRLLHETITGSKLIIVENAGHFLVLERPDVVNREILKFLKDTGY